MMVLDAAAAPKITGPACVDGIGPAGDWQGYWQRTDASQRQADRKLGEWALTSLGPDAVASAADHELSSSATVCGPANSARRQGGGAARSRNTSSNWCASRLPISTACCAARRWWPKTRPALMRAGVTMTTTLLAKDTAHKTVFPVFTPGGGFGMAEMQGAGDFVMVADPATFRCCRGRRIPAGCCATSISQTASRCRSRRGRFFAMRWRGSQTAGFDYLAGLEVEFHLFKLENPRLAPEDATWPPRAPEVSLLNQGYQYLTESRFDQIDAALEPIRRGIAALGMPLRSLEVELGPSQCEFTFRPQAGLDAADTMILFRAATKQIARRHGLLVSFMCRPALPNLFSSGWHLHQSLLDRKRGSNAFAGNAREGLSPLGLHFLAGLLAHAHAAAAFTTPTINGYKRYRRLFAGARPRHLGARQSRRHDARARRAGRSGDASGKPRRRAGGESVSLHGVADLRRPRRHGAQARSRAVGGYAV